MYVNIIIYSNKLLLFVWSTLKKKRKKKCFSKNFTELLWATASVLKFDRLHVI